MLALAPEGWRKVRLEDVCDKITVGHVGPMANEYVDDGIPFLRSQNIKPFKITLEDTKWISPEFHHKIKKSALQPGDVAVIRTGYPGTAAVVPPSLPIANCADLVIIRPSAEIDPWFLSSLFNSVWGQGAVAGNLVGVAQQHFNVGAAKNLAVYLPPIGLQRRIASVLSAYDDLIENNTRRIELLEEMARRLYEEWFVHFRFPGHEAVKFKETERGRIPSAWSWEKLGDVAVFLSRGISPKYDDSSSCRVINQKCIRDQRLHMALSRRQSKKVPTDKFVQFGDVLINSTGVGTLGRVAQVYEALDEVTVDSHVTIVRAGDDADIDFFGLSLQSLQTHFEAQGVGATGQTELSRTSVGDTVVCWPSTEIQREFGHIVRRMRKACVLYSNKNTNLRNQRDLLLPKLVSGEIDVADIPLPDTQGGAPA